MSIESRLDCLVRGKSEVKAYVGGCPSAIVDIGAGDAFVDMMEEENTVRPHQEIAQLSLEEKKFLAVERGDIASTRRPLQKAGATENINVNCVDPLGRIALLMAIDNENLEMVELLINDNDDTKDALLHAISEEFVEAVFVLLDHELASWECTIQHSWEDTATDTFTFTPDITPLILAAHRDNYEIIKILLDRGAFLPMPHDVRCGCDECVCSRQEDSLRHSRSPINAYRALAGPSLIALSSKDPILTAPELSWELRRLSELEHEFKNEYQELRIQCDFATALLDHTRVSHELESLLNHDPTGPHDEHGHRMHLNRLKLAIKLRQKKFVAHPNVQQLLASIWYEGLPGFRRKNMALQAGRSIRIGFYFPIFSRVYILAPHSSLGQTMPKPFIKFICHSSYFMFLFLLILASQRIETAAGGLLWGAAPHGEPLSRRGAPPSLVEWLILAWVSGLIWSEVKQLWDMGLREYVHDMWNVIDFVTNSLYVATVALRIVSHFQVRREMAAGMQWNQPREQWDAWDPMLLSEGLFSAANIFSSLKLVYIFSVNPHLGPLQVSLSRMVLDILKFFVLDILVIFAFSCGLNQLLWYYADMEKKRCTTGSNSLTANGTFPDPDACIVWRRFANLFETMQTLFWAAFGLVDLDSFELDGIKIFTRFWGMLMFGTYSVINIVVLLNLLIAMMNHSYQLISERADVEWKFARSKLWISYFEEGGTCPPPFNIIPTPKSITYNGCWSARVFCIQSALWTLEHNKTIRRKICQASDRDFRYQFIMRNLVRRYVTVEQRKAESQGVTEDDVNEIKQDISAFRCELVEILKNSGMITRGDAGEGPGEGGKKNRQKERRLMKGFNIAPPFASGSLFPVTEFNECLPDLAWTHEEDQTGFCGRFLPKHDTEVHIKCGDDFPIVPDCPEFKKYCQFETSRVWIGSSLKTWCDCLFEHWKGCLEQCAKKRWGTLIEAAKCAEVSKAFGRSKSEDSVCNCAHRNSVPQEAMFPLHDCADLHPIDGAPNHETSTTISTPTPTLFDVYGEDCPNYFGEASNLWYQDAEKLATLAALKRKRKKFSGSLACTPVAEECEKGACCPWRPNPIEFLKRVSSHPAAANWATVWKDADIRWRRHEQTQSQHDSNETNASPKEYQKHPSYYHGDCDEPLGFCHCPDTWYADF
uniref:Transient receptor potential channel gamma n=1 Tax=Spodoptera littoralis TaxID=7109 RepID=B3G505_SPOLI|nr:transient receptor potential channel gamma [Spodoptera littoralis]